ncbi:MAG: hypothetical protein B7Y80_18680 [Hyphomicrobium sp. 32-62-53]|nr:MAG: hypothetical protein B7Y80_18680 [Hyphomicrobium sp. 32-62-53]
MGWVSSVGIGLWWRATTAWCLAVLAVSVLAFSRAVADRHTDAVVLWTATVRISGFQRGRRLERRITVGAVTAPPDQRHFASISTPIELAADDDIALALPHQDGVERGQTAEIDGVSNAVLAGHGKPPAQVRLQHPRARNFGLT